MSIRKRVTQIRTRVVRRWAAEVLAYWSARPVDDGLVFYESFNGNGVLDSPEAVFRAVLADPEHRGLRHVWSLSDENDNSAVRAEFAADPRVRFVRPGSGSYLRARTTARWLFSNATFDRQFDRRPGQVYVNTWHGTPLKNMGFDIGDPAHRVANVVRNFLHADVLVSPNTHTTEVLYRRAHRLDGIAEKPVLESGLPRIDRQFIDDEARSAVRAELDARGLDVGQRQIVLWAPTWRGTSFVRPQDDADLLLDRLRMVRAGVDQGRFVVLLKTHQVVHHFAAARPGGAGVLVPNDIPTNLLLAVTDVLVTDYSSIFFDYLALDRPIVFFAPDIGEYASYRGLSISPDEWPGPVVTSAEQVAAEIARPSDVQDRSIAMRQRMNPHDDGGATARLIEAVFSDRSQQLEGTVHPPSVLVVLPAAVGADRIVEIVDGVNRLDLDTLDVSVMLSDARSGWYLQQLERLDPKVRQFVRQGHRNGSVLPARLRRVIRTIPPSNRAEWHRLLADLTFDVVVDAAARSAFWADLAAAAPGRARLRWDGPATVDRIHRTVAIVRAAS